MIICEGEYGPPIFEIDDCYGNDPFLGDPDFPAVIQTIPKEEERLTVVLLSHVGHVYFVWVVEKQRLEVMEFVTEKSKTKTNQK